MTKLIQAVRGMNDILPEQSKLWQFAEQIFRDVAASYGYHEIRFPIVESTDLFKRSIGEITDIVEKEMYTFADRNGDFLTLRPEGTAVCVRACLEHGLLHNQEQRLWYAGPMFRHERPQKGRYRQFHQFGIENFGAVGPDVDAEIILLSARLWSRYQISNDVTLHLNSLGTPAARAAYRQILVDYFTRYADQLDEDSKRRLHLNPLRILDSKNPALQEIILQAPKLSEHLDEESRAHFTRLCKTLDAAQINYVINPRLVRGLDYYSKTVFEWVTTKIGAQGTVCGGGRYDGLVEQLGGKPTPAVGFSIGIERLLTLLEESPVIANLHDAPHAYLIMAGEVAELRGQLLAEQLRDQLPHLRLLVNTNGGSFKSQFKRADKCKAQLALILGEEEIAQNKISVKYLQKEQAQLQVTLDDLIVLLKQLGD